MNTLELLDFNLRKKSIRTRERYTSIARIYLGFSGDMTGGDVSRTTMLRFMEWTESKGWSPNTRRLAHYVLAKLCKSLEKKFPLDADDLATKPTREELRTPFLSMSELGRLISHQKAIPSYGTALLFLASIWGLRSTELTNVEIGDGAIRVFLAKKRGTARQPKIHLLPSGDGRFLDGYEWASEGTVIAEYHKLCRAIGLKSSYGAWHMVRRTLDTALHLAGVNPEIISRYIGWQQGNSFGVSPMVSRYFHMTDEDVDKETYKLHPVLPLWGIK